LGQFAANGHQLRCWHLVTFSDHVGSEQAAKPAFIVCAARIVSTTYWYYIRNVLRKVLTPCSAAYCELISDRS
jgi:hypothetical protein